MDSRRVFFSTTRQEARHSRIGRVGQWSVAERNPPSGNQFGGLRCADPPYELQTLSPCVGSLLFLAHLGQGRDVAGGTGGLDEGLDELHVQ